MIWLRRVLAIPLIVIFVITLILALVLTHLSGTVGSAGFYNGQMRQAHVYDWVYDNLTPAALDEAGIEMPTDFPVDTPELKRDIVAVAKQAFPPKWLQGTFENATRQIFPYVMGDKNSFTITIDVQSRIGPMADGINGVVDNHTQEIYDYVTDELIVPAMTEQLGLGAALPYGITLTDEEISGFVAQAMPQDWAIAQFKSMINSLAGYLKGDVNNLNLNIDLAAVKTNAFSTLTTLADQKLETAFNDLPTCTPLQFSQALATLQPNTLPSCRPVGYTYDQFKQALETKLGMTIAQAVDQNVIDLIPNSYYFNDAQLRQALGEDMAKSLDEARKFIVDDQGQRTEQNFGSASGRADFDKVRPVIHAVRTWLWALWLIPILLLVAIGFLCGRNWKSRLLWPLGVLLVTCLIAVTLVAVLRTLVPQTIIEIPEETVPATKIDTMIADKADEIVHNAINTFIWGFEVKLILFLVFSGLAIAGVIAWAIVDRNRRRRLTQHDPDGPPA